MSGAAAIWDGYGRVSQVGARDAESERFHSTALQQTSVEGWLQRHGFRLGAWVEDLNLSGGTRRPKLEELVARVESGVSAGLAVYNLSRFSRETLLGLSDIDRIVVAGGRFVAVNDGVDTDDPNWRLNATIRLAIDSDYLRRTKDGFRAVRQRLVAMGVHVTNWDNVGYLRGEDLRYHPHPEFGPVMREAFRLRASDYSLRQVADLLADGGVISGRAVAERRAGGQLWTTGGVRTVLRHPVYLGWAYWGRVRGGGRLDFEFVNREAHEPLVDPETFTAANRPRNERRPRKPSALLDAYLLRGLVRCAGCSHSLKPDRYIHHGLARRMYRCRKRHQNGRCPESTAIEAESLEAYVTERVLAALGRESVAGRVPHRDIDRLRQAVKGAEAELAGFLRVARATLPGFEDSLRVREAALQSARQALEAHRGATVVGLPSVLVADELWPTLSPDHRRTLLGSALEFVVVRRSVADGRRRSLADRVGFVWTGQAEPDLSRPGFSAEVRPYPFPWDATATSGLAMTPVIASPGDPDRVARHEP